MAISSKSLPVRLSKFEVYELFNEFHYNIELKTDERITAIIAPNGSGKTVCLRMINALFRRKWSVFNSVEFRNQIFRFTDGRSITITKLPTPVQEDDPTTSKLNLQFDISYPPEVGFEDVRWTPRDKGSQITRLQSIERYLPFVTRVAPARWIHDHTNQSFTAAELIEAYADQLPSRLVEGFYSTEPSVLKDLIDNIDCHLIETQRLLIFPTEDRNYRLGRHTPSQLAIAQKAETLKDIIARNLTEYATLSQSLDRSFPRRVIRQSDIKPPENLKAELQALDEQRKRLLEAGILASEGTEPVNLPPGDIEPAVARLLDVYVNDNRRKLASLESLRQRVQLFKELIDERFRHKTTIVDREAGFRVQFRDHDVPLDRLSSGEQHQLVLFFELLFELKENALILIDEPELSLHVSWQRKFIPDLQRIIALNKFDVVLATHSPQLVGHWADLVVEPRSGDDDDDDADDLPED